MGKRTVFEQIVKLIPRREFSEIVARFEGDKRVRELSCWTWVGALLFGQLTGHDSIRAMERVFCHGRHRFSKLGFGAIRRSTLAEANQIRPLEILRETLALVIHRSRELCPSRHRFPFKGPLLALDASIIRLCLALSPWAQYHHGKGGCKLHTAIDLAGNLPEFVYVTKGRAHDVPVARAHFSFETETTLIFDRGYWNVSWLNDLNQHGVYFVTRERKNNRFKVVESRQTNRTQGYICDQTVYHTIDRKKYRDRPKYQGTLRRITYRDPESNHRYTFLTNRFDLDVTTICELYKARWEVELFFKTLKQNLRIKKFLGTTLHAVTAQILIAMIAYVLVHILRNLNKARLSMPDAMAVISTLLLLQEPVQRLFGALPRTSRHPPTSQLSFNY
jgi:putative transposase